VGGPWVPLKPGCGGTWVSLKPGAPETHPLGLLCNHQTEPNLQPGTGPKRKKFGQGGSRTSAEGSVAQREACGVSFPSVGPLGLRPDI